MVSETKILQHIPVVTAFILQCDGCGKTVRTTGGFTRKTVRKRYAGYGWTFDGDHCYCPKCSNTHGEER